jgi:hypothetical protein
LLDLKFDEIELKTTFPVELHDGHFTFTVSPDIPETVIVLLHFGHLTVFSIISPQYFVKE